MFKDKEPKNSDQESEKRWFDRGSVVSRLAKTAFFGTVLYLAITNGISQGAETLSPQIDQSGEELEEKLDETGEELEEEILAMFEEAGLDDPELAHEFVVAVINISEALGEAEGPVNLLDAFTQNSGS